MRFLVLLLVCGSANAYSLLVTPRGTEFSVDGSGPVVIVLATSIKETHAGGITTLPRELVAAGFSVVSLDLPCHGVDAGWFSKGLTCWRERMDRRELDFSRFASKVSDVLTFLQRDQAAIVGVSRGAYPSFIAAAMDPRITRVVAIGPVTELTALSEFKGAATGGLAPYQDRLASKRMFLTMQSDDDRVSTKAALRFVAGVQSRGGKIDVHLVPGRGHNTVIDNAAIMAWLTQSPP